MALQWDDEPFAFDENPAAFDRARSIKRTAEELAEQQQIYTHAILQFVENKRLDEILSQSELASMKSGPRFFVLMKGILPNMLRVYRREPRPDTQIGALILIHFCADNSDGLCRLSIKRFSQILNRKDENIRIAINKLEKGGEIVVYHSVHGNSYRPIIDRVVHETDPNLSWFLDAFSEKPTRVGRPSKAENTPPLAGKYPPASGVHNSLRKIANKRGKGREGRVERSKRPQLKVIEARP